MKNFIIVIFVIVSGLFLQGSARKVCILYEQTKFPITILSAESITIKEETSDITEVISDVKNEISEVTDEAVTEILSDVPETISKLTDISVISNDGDLNSPNICALEGITLFDDQNDLLRTMCTITASPSSLYVVTVQNSTVRSDLALASLCTDGPRGLLSWIAWQDFIDKIRPLLSANELPQLVVRNLSIGAPSESQSKVDPFSEVLIEMLPVGYRLQNIKPSAWNNNTFIKTVLLGNIELENSNGTERHVEGDLNYSFLIETNTTFLSSYPISGLPVEMTDESDEKKNFIVGSTNSYIYDNTFSVERLVPPFKKETVSVKGTYGLRENDIEATIISIFGVNKDGTTIEESHTISARVVTLGTFDIKDVYYLEDFTTTTTEEQLTTTEELPIPIPFKHEAIYPGFKNVFYVACVLFFGTMIIAFVDVIRKLRRDRIEKSKGRRTYQKIQPKF